MGFLLYAYIVHVLSVSHLLTPVASDTYDQHDMIQLHPESQAVTLNSTVRLQCRVRMLIDPETGSSALVSWSKNDFGIGTSRADIQEYGKGSRYDYSRYDLPYNLQEGQYDLQISNVELADEGSYMCHVDYMKQQYLSQTAILTVLVPSEAPQLYQLEKSGRKTSEKAIGSASPAVVEDGQLLQVKCIARHGKPGASLQWFIDGVPVKSERKGKAKHGAVEKFESSFSGNLTTKIGPSVKFPRLKDTTSTISARLNQLHHGKLLECRASNRGYEAHALRPAQTKIEVHYAPVVSIHIRPQRSDNEYSEHDVITVECSAHGRPDSFYWEWFVDGRQVSDVNDPWYRLRLTREMHNSVFRCVAISTKKGHAETTIKLKFGPQFQEPSALLYTASPGEDVEMDCPARGNPEPQVEWRREGSQEILYRGTSFRKNNLQSTDFGTYICTAYVHKFPPISKQMYIARRRPPKIKHNPVVHARLGRPARLRCAVDSVPLPSEGQTGWLFHGRQLRPDSQYHFEREEFIGGVVLVLHIKQIMFADYGTYNCTVRNGYGSDWSLIELKHQDDVPLQFIIGAAIIVGVLLIIGLILLCVCRRRICGGYSIKKRQSDPDHPLHSRMRQPRPMSSLSNNPDYGVLNQKFTSPNHTGDPNGNDSSSFYATSWLPANGRTYMACNQDVDDQSSGNGSRVNMDKRYSPIPQDGSSPNITYTTGLTNNYYPTMSNCQLLQPIGNGGAYLSTLDPRLFNAAQSTAFIANGCPTLLGAGSPVTGNMAVPISTLTTNTGSTDFLLSPADQLSNGGGGYFIPAANFTNMNGQVGGYYQPNPIADSTSTRSSFIINNQTDSPVLLGPGHTLANVNLIPGGQTIATAASGSRTNSPLIGEAGDDRQEDNRCLIDVGNGFNYVINEHTTNV